MELFNCPNGCYIRVTDQYEPEPYSGLKRGDQIDLEVMIAQYEWENGERVEHRIQVAPGSPQILPGDIVYLQNLDGMYSFGYRVDPTTFEHQDIVHLAAWTDVEIINPDPCQN